MVRNPNGRSNAHASSLPTPPAAGRYVSHAIAVKQSLAYLHEHLKTFIELIPEDKRDGVIEPRTAAALADATLMAQQAAQELITKMHPKGDNNAAA
jgi:hypothetical protein